MKPTRRERIPDALSLLPPLPEHPLVSVVIPALDEERHIGACIEAVENQTYPRDLIEIVVADGGSNDRTREIVQLHAATTRLRRIVLVDNPERTTPDGLNAGIRRAEGEVVINLIAHVVPDLDFVANNVAVLKQSGAAASGGPVQTAPGDSTVVAEGIASALSSPLSVGRAHHRFGATAADLDTLYYGAYRKECFEVLGGFDPDRLQSEDDTFNLRVLQAGGRLRFDPRIRSTYHARATYRALARQYYRFGRAKGRVAFEEEHALSPRHLAPLVATTGMLKLSLGAVVLRPLRVPAALLVFGYAAAVSLAGISSSRRRKRPYAWGAAAVAFPVIHASYAVGMLAGLLGALPGSKRRSSSSRM